MDVREKLAVIAHLGDHISYKEDIGICYDSALAKVIEDAYMELKNGVTVQEWIPVTERLPEESGMYIVTANDGHAQRVSFVLWQKKNRVWNLTGARSYWMVTHWQPMPQPPKGE